MSAQSYPGAVYGRQSPFPAELAIHLATELFAPWFFFQPIASRRAPVPHRIPGLVFSTVDPPTSQKGKKKVESRVQKTEIPKGADFSKSQIQRIGTRPAGCATSVCRATRGREKATLGHVRRLPDLAVNFQGLHTCARGRRAASTRRPVLLGAANPNGRVGNGAGTRRGAPFRERAKRARRRAARRHRARRRLVFRNRVTSLGDARRWRAPRPRTCTCCSWTTTGRVVPSSRACSRSATTRVSPESRPARARIRARRREDHVTSLQSVDVVFPPRWTRPARAPERRSD